MNKKLFVFLSVILALLLVILPTFAKNVNGKKKKYHGIWCYTPDIEIPWEPIDFYDTEEPDHELGQPGRQMIRVPYTGIWTGVISGESKEYGALIMHESGPLVFQDAATFAEAEVMGKTGSLYMDAFGQRLEDGSWVGDWIITGGTDELENFTGHGKFWGPGWQMDPNECGVIYYAVDELNGVKFKGGHFDH
jgi:hypothetical protein